MSSSLALFGGPKAVQTPVTDTFSWPIISKEAEEAALQVLRRGAMSGMDVTKEFEADYAAWQGTEFALAFSTGTGALQAAMYGCGVRTGDDIIAPSVTYWASALPVFSLGGTVSFAEVDPDTLCLDPADIEHRITPRTKAIVVVHYCGYPADMDPIMEIAEKHGIKVIEDVSHAHGGIYKGRKLGAIGHVAAMSLMSGKALAIGEGGMLTTNDREIYETGIAWGHYGRFNDDIQSPTLRPFRGLPMGGYKYRMHQVSSAVGRVQLKEYDARNTEILKAMNRFWDLLEDVPGVKAHRPPKDSGCEMGGWYAAHGLYRPEQIDGLSITRFCEALRAEGVSTSAGCNRPLHLHPLFNTCDIYGIGKPTRNAHTDRDMTQPRGSLPISEQIGRQVYSIPWFKYDRPDIIAEHANAFRKVVENRQELLKDDPGDPEMLGDWHFFTHA
jgi:dTDP-4-amino-4,6-dideoxygalactose transaminase